MRFFNPERNRFRWLGRLGRCGVGQKKRLKTGFQSSPPQYDALDTTLSQDTIA